MLKSNIHGPTPHQALSVYYIMFPPKNLNDYIMYIQFIHQSRLSLLPLDIYKTSVFLHNSIRSASAASLQITLLYLS